MVNESKFACKHLSVRILFDEPTHSCCILFQKNTFLIQCHQAHLIPLRKDDIKNKKGVFLERMRSSKFAIP